MKDQEKKNGINLVCEWECPWDNKERKRRQRLSKIALYKKSSLASRNQLLLVEDAVGVVGDGRGPVGEDSDHADVASEHVEHHVHVGILADRLGHRLLQHGTGAGRHVLYSVYCERVGHGS